MKQSKNGEFCPHINKTLTEKINLLCEITGENRTQYVSKVVSEAVNKDINRLREIYKEDNK